MPRNPENPSEGWKESFGCPAGLRVGTKGGGMRAILSLLRPHHWIKNAFCFAGVVFSGRFLEVGAIQAGAMAALSFCLLSSAVYALNDIRDVASDRQHPRKRLRPLASGAIGVGTAAWVGAVCAAAGMGLGMLLGERVAACSAIYLGVNLAYSLRLKFTVLVDVMCIAFGFVLRLLAGVYAVEETPTVWIVLCTFFLALFLALSKRRAELAVPGDNGCKDRRPVLAKYSVELLDLLVVSSASICILCYALFTGLSGRNPSLVATVPLVWYAIMRYVLLLRKSACAEEPEKLLVSDPGIMLTAVVWLLAYIGIHFGGLEWVE